VNKETYRGRERWNTQVFRRRVGDEVGELVNKTDEGEYVFRRLRAGQLSEEEPLRKKEA
jgi:hypothetical protein